MSDHDGQSVHESPARSLTPNTDIGDDILFHHNQTQQRSEPDDSWMPSVPTLVLGSVVLVDVVAVLVAFCCYQSRAAKERKRTSARLFEQKVLALHRLSLILDQQKRDSVSLVVSVDEQKSTFRAMLESAVGDQDAIVENIVKSMELKAMMPRRLDEAM